MRRYLYVLLILLLPLRGWVGDAMAAQMAFPASSHPMAVADAASHRGHADMRAHAHLSSSGAPMVAADGAGHGESGASGPDETAHCGVCALCQTCHTVAVLHTIELADAGPSRPAVPQPAALGFASADRALALKPPTA